MMEHTINAWMQRHGMGIATINKILWRFGATAKRTRTAHTVDLHHSPLYAHEQEYKEHDQKGCTGKQDDGREEHNEDDIPEIGKQAQAPTKHIEIAHKLETPLHTRLSKVLDSILEENYHTTEDHRQTANTRTGKQS